MAKGWGPFFEVTRRFRRMCSMDLSDVALTSRAKAYVLRNRGSDGNYVILTTISGLSRTRERQQQQLLSPRASHSVALCP